MRIALKSLVLAAGLAFPIGTACAATEYFVEFGRQASEEEAMEQWQALKSKYPDMLGDLAFHPQTVLQVDNRVMTRIQAGPLPSKRAAAKICSRLFYDDVPCFVIEGEGTAAPAAEEKKQETEEKPAEPVALAEAAEPEIPEEIAMSEVASPAPQPEEQVELPWLKGRKAIMSNAQPSYQAETRPAEAEQETQEESAFLPWLFGSSDKAEAKEPPAQAEVEVAEAIRVPLSNAIAEVPAPVMAPTFKAPTASEYLAEKPLRDGVWLSIGAFGDESDASAFWREARNAAPARTMSLRVRIARPLMSRRAAVSLNVGPFPGRDEADAFCREAVAQLNPELSCRASLSGSPASSLSTSQRRGNTYEARRRMATEQGQARHAPSTHARSGGSYWLQLASSPSQDAAFSQWKALRANNADLLGGLRTRITGSLGGRRGYTVQAGPVDSAREAARLCDGLSARGVACSVYSGR